MLSSELILLVFFAVPLLLSGAVGGLQRLRPDGPDDATDKRLLWVMLAPIAIGVVVVLIARLAPVDVPLPLLPMVEADFRQVSGDVTAAPVTQGIDILAWLPEMGLALYGAIASLLGVRLGWAYIRMAGIGASARRQPGLGDDVWVTPAAIPPLTWGRRILVPQSLVSDLPLANLSLIVRHEREHLRRGDPLWFAALAWIDVLAWFNPFIRHQTARCRLAAELACDAAVTAALPDMRQIYAETLVIALKHAAGNVLAYAPAAFSNAQSGDYRMRIMQIMRPSHDGRKPRRLLFAAIAVLALPAAFAQYAWSQAPAATAEKPADTVTVFPVSGRISSGFGPRIHPITKEPSFHSGIDFAVHEGTEVHSIAAGTVSFAGEREGYHQVVEIDHGGGLKTRYAQLGSVRVKAGDKVKVDRVVATSGAYGTGPHLHFEVWQDAKPVDPYAVLNPESSSAFNMNWSADEMAFAGDVRLQKGDRTLMADELRVRR